MKTDALFYELFRRWPGVALDLAGLDPALADHYQFRTEEIKQTALRLDGLLTSADDSDNPTLIYRSPHKGQAGIDQSANLTCPYARVKQAKS